MGMGKAGTSGGEEEVDCGELVGRGLISLPGATPISAMENEF